MAEPVHKNQENSKLILKQDMVKRVSNYSFQTNNLNDKST